MPAEGGTAIELQTLERPPASAAADVADVVIEGITRGFARGRSETVTALEDVSLRALRSEVVAVVGPSGCGKTTLLELVCGLQQPDAGSLRAEPAALMPQRDLLLPWLTALDNAALALRIAGRGRAQSRARAAELFAELGLAGFEGARPAELSGGMRQRVAFIRTLLSGKPVLCLDEPFGALDAITRAEMQDWLAGALAREPRTVLLVTHDVEEAIVLADRVVVLSPRPGRVVAEVPVALGRPRERTGAGVVELRERALRALAGGRA
ncbi:MAG TPA: ABC transporter ATP-binding protein [Solirubrobacteraceae bacterium]|jgi:NitT/TauT family transport system ATP-binding protein|nr:ABC transporter ATP-binding protein [Solirubrobacteraceae bacterium]